MSEEKFTKDEKELLMRFVTNVDKPVFVLRNLPEVIKGALFSRYSRSVKGLRRLLLDEFINNPEGGFLVGKEHNQEQQLLKLQKAQDFYDRILDGYGDDSIGELGGAHLAFEQVSNIASKYIEDCRIGGSPLEKSTRYVRFDEKVKGKYQYYREPRILDSKHGDAYVELMDSLFETYSKFIDPLIGFVREKMPRDENVPKWAYEASVKAHALDAIRGLLPASTLTNVGLFGNGRFFETLLLKLKTSPLTEMRELGRVGQDELDKVVPSFVRRAQYGNKHFPTMAEHRKAVDGSMREVSIPLMKNSTEGALREVALVDYDDDAEDRVLASALYPQLHLPFDQLLQHVKYLNDEEREKLVGACLAGRKNRRHKPGRAFEHARYTFDICADFGCYRDLQRHRMLTQERQLLSTQHGYDMPKLLVDAGIEKDYCEAMERAAEGCSQIAQDMPEEAQYAVPFGYRLRWYFTINLRALVWLCELRTTAHGHPNYRRVAQGMYSEVKNVHPRLSKCFKFVDMNNYALGRLDSEIKSHERKQNAV